MPASQFPSMLLALMDALSYFFTGTKVKPLADGQANKDLYTHPIWSAIKRGDRDAVEEEVEEDLNCMYLRGDVGETPIHWCFLYYRREQRDIARALLSQHPALAETVYAGEMYCGESILHMAIVHHDLEMVRFLLQLWPSLIYKQATGSFFKPGSPCYYGEHPLCFAACTDQKDVVDFLVEYRAPLDTIDAQGNSIFHLLVLHDLPEMYDYVEELWKTKHTDRDPSLLLNKDLLSPLTYAASLGCKGMFEHLLAKKDTIMEWHFGPTSLCLYPLDEVDYLPHPLPGQKTAIQLLLDKAHVDLLFIPGVHVIIMQKWVNFAHRIFFSRLAFIIVYFLLFTTTVIFTDTPMTTLQRYCFEAAHSVVLLIAVILLQSKLRQLWSMGLWGYFAAKGSAFLENVFPLVFSSSLCVVYGMRIATARDLAPPEEARLSFEAPLLALAALFGWCYIFLFFLGFRLTGPFVVMIWSMLVGDVLRFFSIYSIFLMAFSTSFHVLWGHQGVEEYGRQLQANFLMMVGDFEPFYSRFASSEHRQLTVFFMVFYIVLVSILLVNLLIAMMGATFSAISEASDRRWFLEWARIICSLEQELSPEDRAQYFEEREVNGTMMRYIRVYDGSQSHREDWGESFKFTRQQSQFVHSRKDDWDLMMSPSAAHLRRTMMSGVDLRNSPPLSYLRPNSMVDYSSPVRTQSPPRLLKARSDCFLSSSQSTEKLRLTELSMSIPGVHGDSKRRSRKVSTGSISSEFQLPVTGDKDSDKAGAVSQDPTPTFWRETTAGEEESPPFAWEPPIVVDPNGVQHPQDRARSLEREVQRETLLLLKEALQKVEQAAALARALLQGADLDPKPSLNGLTSKQSLVRLQAETGTRLDSVMSDHPNVIHSEPSSHPKPFLMGTANIWLYSLAHMLEFRCQVAIISPDGESEGQLSAALLPCDAKGGSGPWDDDPALDPYVEDSAALLATTICFQLFIEHVSLFPAPTSLQGEARRAFSALSCRYKWDAEDPSEEWSETATVQLQLPRVTFNFKKEHTVYVDSQALQRLQSGCLQMEVWAVPVQREPPTSVKFSEDGSTELSAAVFEQCRVLEDLEVRLASQQRCLTALLT
eukprot:GGOE01001784.1.p1 GENE.GGOE01001784.1~~GGOE01001784.1.p1  ORF type:complete len:1098 (+),score=322.37 GGOE01001784.1:96-3389(+)